MPKTETFKFEGDLLRIKPLGEDSGVLFTKTPGTRKWVLECNFGLCWVQDACIYLPNKASLEDAVKQFGF